MRTPSTRAALEAAGLLASLAFVFSMGLIPHLGTYEDPSLRGAGAVSGVAQAAWEGLTGERSGYPYPLHVDENWHWLMISDLQRSRAIDPAASSEETVFSLRQDVHEKGFHLVIAEIQTLTGISFQRIFQYLPALWLSFTAFGVYAALRPHPSALPAALFVGLVPTTVRFLGPAFLVPIGFVLAWLPAALILSQPARRHLGAAVLLLVLLTWCFFLHLMGGFVAVGLVVLGALMGALRHRRAALLVSGLALLPVLWLFRTFTKEFEAEVERGQFLPVDFTIFDVFGVPALFFWAVAVILIALRPPREHAVPILTFTVASVLCLGAILAYSAFDVKNYALYDRMHTPFFLTAAVPMGYAVHFAFVRLRAGVEAFGATRARLRVRHPVPQTLAGIAAAALVLVVVSPGAQAHLDTPYYYPIDDRDWEAFTWITWNTGTEHQVFLTHPWKAPVLAAMTGKKPHTYLVPGTPPINGEDYLAYVQTGGSLEFFVMNDITLVITTGKPPFDEFVPLTPGVWALDPSITRELYEIRTQPRQA